MHKDYQLIPPLSKQTIKITLPLEKQIKLEIRCKELGMSRSEYIIYLMDEVDGDDIKTIINFRYNLRNRIKKGINRLYINQLIKLQKQLNLLLDKL
jgi:hypothetical protein